VGQATCYTFFSDVTMKTRRALLVAAALAFTSFGIGETARTADKAIGSNLADTWDAERTTRLEHTLDDIRQQLKIPAMSCAIVKDQRVVWAKGLGYADLENKIPATEHTSYHLASLTKTFASTILMQLVQDGKVK